MESVMKNQNHTAVLTMATTETKRAPNRAIWLAKSESVKVGWQKFACYWAPGEDCIVSVLNADMISAVWLNYPYRRGTVQTSASNHTYYQ